MRVGVLLAGGESRRMGRDKRGLRLGGETLLRRNLAFLGGVFPVVGLSVRSAAQAPADLPDDVVIIPDEVPGSPMGGLAGILAHFGEPIFALAADLIAPDPAAVARVLDAYRDVDVSLPVAEDHLEPLHAVYGPRCLPHMRQLLAAGAHSILDLFPLVRVARVPFADTTPFFNVNTPDDWAEARRRVDGADAGARTSGVADDAPGASAGAGDRRAAGGPVVLGVVGRPEQRQDHAHREDHPRAQPPRPARRRRQARRQARDRPPRQGLVAALAGRRGGLRRRVTRQGRLRGAEDGEATLEEIVARYFGGFDVVVCEGYRREAPDVVEIFRSGAGYESTVCELHEPVALVTDADLAHPHRFGLDDTPALVSFLVERLGLTPHA